MNRLNFAITINAPASKVYRTMLDDASYREWTKVFNGQSRYKGTWEKGSKMVFIGTDDKGNQGGMVSRIKDIIPNRLVSIEHLGLLEGDMEITTGEKVESWAGALENYHFSELDGVTELRVEMDINDEFKDYMNNAWPKALDKLKSLCEQ